MKSQQVRKKVVVDRDTSIKAEAMTIEEGTDQSSQGTLEGTSLDKWDKKKGSEDLDDFINHFYIKIPAPDPSKGVSTPSENPYQLNVSI